jgi:hypothetical protein
VLSISVLHDEDKFPVGDSHGDECEGYCVLRYDVVYIGILLPGKRRQHVPSRR